MTMPGHSMSDVPKDVKTVSNIGPATQNLNPTKVKSTSQGRMSSGFLGSRGGLTSGLATTATNLFGGFMGDIVDDTTGTTVESPDDVSTQVEGFFGNPGSKLFDGVLGLLSPILQGLSGGLSGIAGTLASLFGMRWDQVDFHDETITDLQDKTQKLQDVVGYGCAYMNTTTSTDFKGTKKKMAFATQVGPIVGCTMDGFGYVLGSKGLWRADLQMTFDTYAIGVKTFDMDIRVYAPDGTLYDQQLFPDNTGSRAARTNVFSFVVPSAGYKVYAYAQCAIGRGMLGGTGRSGFYVTKISGETN